MREAVGDGSVVASSRMFQRCYAFASTYWYAQVYGVRQLVTVDGTYSCILLNCGHRQ